jgi:hypothetical protein
VGWLQRTVDSFASIWGLCGRVEKLAIAGYIDEQRVGFESPPPHGSQFIFDNYKKLSYNIYVINKYLPPHSSVAKFIKDALKKIMVWYI